MRTKSIYLVALLLMGAVATFGKDDPTPGMAVFSAKGTDVFKVVYRTETANNVKVKLYNTNGDVIHSASINNTTGFILPLNLGQLNYGDYRLELTDTNGKHTETIAYQKAEAVDNIRIARLATGDDKFVVSVVNDKNETVTVKIFDSYYNLLHTEVKSVSGDFAQVYNVKNLRGACTFEVSDDAGRVKTVQF